MNVKILKQTIVIPTLFVVTRKDLTSVDVSRDMREMALIAQVRLVKSMALCHNDQHYMNGSNNS